MTKAPRVYGGNWCGTHRMILACNSISAFSAATKIHSAFVSQTGNVEEVTKALSNPGTIFRRANSGKTWEIYLK